MRRSPGLPALAAACLLLAGIAPGLEASEQRNLVFRRISMEQGLSQATVHAIAQDNTGFIWVGTQEGLNRYDGREFTLFGHDTESADSLSHDSIRSLLVDAGGAIWIGTDGGGLNRFDPATRSFTRFRNDPGDPDSLSGDRVRVIYEDGSGSLWIGTDGGGLNRFDGARQTFVSFTHDPSSRTSLSNDKVSSLLEDHRGVLWVGTAGGGLNRLDPETGRFRHYRHEPGNPESLSDDKIKTLFEDLDGNLWIGTYEGGLNRFDPERGTFERYQHDPQDPGSLSANRVRGIFQDSQGTLWIGTDGGLNEWLPQSQSFRAHRHAPTNPASLTDNRVTSIFEDRGGVLWVGTYSGLNACSLASASFAHYRHDANDPSRLSNNVVAAFHEDRDGTVWVGTYGGGLNRFDPRTGTFEHFRHDPAEASSLSDDRVMSLYVDSSGVLWVGTLRGGLNRFDRETGAFDHFRHDPANPRSLGADGVTSILEDRSGELWVATYLGGLNRFDSESGSFIRYRHDPTSGSLSLSSDRVTSLYEDRAGVLWIGTDGGGLNRYDPVSGRFSHYRHDPSNPESLSSDQVWSILEDRRGMLWVGTQNAGLNRWHPTDRRAHRNKFERYTKEDGLLSSVIYGALEDHRGNLWLSTNRGLARFDPARESFRHFDVSQGLQSNDFNSGAFYRASSGEMYFGGPNGFNVFDPGQLRENQHVPPVVITSFLKFNRKVELERPLDESSRLELSHKDSVIAFDFVALDYTAPEKNRYMHRLEGFDRDWVETGPFQRATYTNLDPGKYVFRVKAANNDGVWNEAGTSLALEVAPPPWRSGWAYGLYALFAVALGYSYVRLQDRRRERAQELEATNRSLEMEIGERRRAEDELTKLSLAVEQSPASVMITDPAGTIEYVNPKFKEVTGYEDDEVLGKHRGFLESGCASADAPADLWRTVAEGQAWRGEIHTRKKNGDYFWEFASVSPIKSEDGVIRHIVAVNEDITERKAFEEQILHQSHFDHLTDLPNRILALDRLSRALVQNRDDSLVTTVIAVDLDNFKIVNDTLGHETGDELLKATAQRLTSVLRQSDSVARMGGDEFVVIQSSLKDEGEAEATASRILECFSKPFDLDGRDVFITASLGITVAPLDGRDPQVLLRNADAAMHKAKEKGRNTYRFFAPEMNDKARRRLTLESGLRKAVANGDELYVEFQPIVDVRSQTIVGAEALIRWRSPELGAVFPEEFIPIAEDTGLITEIGELVLRRSCREARAWCAQAGAPLKVSVNVSSRQFRGRELVAATAAALKESGLPPGCLVLEITESLLVEDAATTVEMLRELSEMGVGLSIDDFGTGYSALAYLKKYPFDVLKIDGSFVRDIGNGDGDQALVTAILALGRSMGLGVIAEGVETRQQLEFLEARGCDLIQGYYFSRALSADDFRNRLRAAGQTAAGAAEARTALRLVEPPQGPEHDAEPAATRLSPAV